MWLIIILCIAGVLVFVLLLPLKGSSSYRYLPPVHRPHEMDHVLSRRLLKPGTPEYLHFYQTHPQYRESDDRSRQAPGLLSEKAAFYDPGTFAAASANFEVIDYLGGLTHTDAPAAASTRENNPGENLSTDPGRNSRFIKTWLEGSGARKVGFARLKDYHLYSHKGRGTRSGMPIEMKHRHAVAITVEMSRRMMQSAPWGTSVMESSEQYLRSGVLALKLAAWIRKLGYDATAHIDGHYEVICPLVAVDAGLGTIGRMGLLMTPDLGPRVRISVVTTNMPLSVNGPLQDGSTLHFCHHCKKCARLCPAAAIPSGPREQTDGALRWLISSENCYHFWTTSGTDCGRCISVCPYSHSDNAFHQVIRWAIKNNLVFRRLAIKLDDIFYGPRPAIKRMPDWSDIRVTP